jgi:hypothetical protein
MLYTEHHFVILVAMEVGCTHVLRLLELPPADRQGHILSWVEFRWRVIALKAPWALIAGGRGEAD